MRTLLFLVLTVALSLPVLAQSVPTKRDDIRQLVTITGTIAIMKQSMERSIAQLRPSFKQLPDAFWAELPKEMDYEALLEKILPVYEAHFTHDDVKALLAFYRSPIGQKSIRELPLIMQESSVVGREWGEATGRRIMEKIQRAQPDSTGRK